MNAISCTMLPGGFSGEIGFQMEFAGGSHIGLASRRHFWRKDRTPLGKDSVVSAEPGYVAVRVIREEDGDLLVSIPDGEVLKVRSDQILTLEHSPNVPVGS